MKRLLSLLSFVLLAGSLVFAVTSPGEDVATLTAKFRSALRGASAERTAALEALAASAVHEAFAPIAEEHGRAASAVREARDESFRSGYQLERIDQLIATLEKRAERDESLKSSIDVQRKKAADLSRKVADARRKLGVEEPWRDELAAAAARLFQALDGGKQKKIEKELWQSVEEGGDTAKASAVEMLGRVGGTGTALELQVLVDGLLAERVKAVREQRKMEAEVRKFERRIQEEQTRDGGRHSPATQEQYERAKEASASLVARTTLDARLIDAAVEAGSRSLAREPEKELEKSVASLLRAGAKAKAGGGVKVLEMLGATRAENVRSRLRAVLAEEEEPLTRSTIIAALAASGDLQIVDELCARHLADANWLVRSAAAGGLAKLRDKRGVPALIARLEVEDEGRVRTDVVNALQDLTHQRFRADALLWQRWWQDVADTFEVPAADAVAAEASAQAEETVGVTFFGIRTESQRVVFVFDLSRSMNFSMVPRANPDDDPNRDPDMPRDGEISRLEAAKADLAKAMGGLRDGAKFNIVFYATDVWTWRDQLETMDEATRAEALATVAALEATGGTNIYGALKAAFELAGVEQGNEWSAPAVDTIFLLTDGRPSVGVTTDPDEILTLVREWNESAGITIHTIGLSGAQDGYLLQSLAEQNGGDYAAR